MKTVLVPTDFSENATKALHFAANIAVKTGATLEIMSVNTAMAYLALMPEMRMAQDEAAVEFSKSLDSDLAKLAAELPQQESLAGLQVRTRVAEGFLHNAINSVIETDGCDLVVMGTQGATGATEFFVGSNTEKVIRTAKCPVLAIPKGCADFNLGTVVLATTLGADQRASFEELAAWQRKFNFDVKILYLNDPQHFGSDEGIKTAAQNLCNATGLKNVETFGSNNIFNEEKAILKFAEEVGADMIAMGTHQRHGLSHMIFGSLAEDTANHSIVPVLCVPIG